MVIANIEFVFGRIGDGPDGVTAVALISPALSSARHAGVQDLRTARITGKKAELRTEGQSLNRHNLRIGHTVVNDVISESWALRLNPLVVIAVTTINEMIVHIVGMIRVPIRRIHECTEGVIGRIALTLLRILVGTAVGVSSILLDAEQEPVLRFRIEVGTEGIALVVRNACQ